MLILHHHFAMLDLETSENLETTHNGTCERNVRLRWSGQRSWVSGSGERAESGRHRPIQSAQT